MMDLEIRQAQVTDAIQIAECLMAAFAPFRHLYTSDAFADTVSAADAVRDRIERMTVYIAVAPAGSVVGTLAAACSEQEGHLRGMAVRPEWQGHGIARRLLMAAEHHLIRSGCSRITLDTTDPLTKAICLYESCGFVRSGRVEDYFGMPLYEFVKWLPATENFEL